MQSGTGCHGVERGVICRVDRVSCRVEQSVICRVDGVSYAEWNGVSYA